MTTKHGASFSTNPPTQGTGDPAKLVSLLALAAAAAAVPQTSNADIIFTAANAHVGFAGGDSSSFFLTLQGTTAQLGFEAVEHLYSPNYGISSTRVRRVNFHLTVGSGGLQGQNGLAFARDQGAAWNPGLPDVYVYALIHAATANRYRTAGDSTSTVHKPSNGYDHKYYAFQFDAGGNRYGWIEVGLSPTQPSLTIYGYAYDTTGAELAMGSVVPEPAPAALLALAALALGAPGLRFWRQHRATAGKS